MPPGRPSRHRRPRLEREEPELRIAPLVDTVFLLLIFFMVTVDVPARETSVRLELVRPGDAGPAPAAAPAPAPAPLIVRIDARCGLFLGEKAVVADELKGLLRRRLREQPDLSVAVEGAPETPAQCVVDVLDACAEAGVRRFGLARPGK